jgi:hypothetical protein
LVLAAVGFLWLGSNVTPSRGDLITDLAVSVSPSSGGLNTYAYSVTVESTSTLGASQLFLSVAPSADLSSISAPTGWDVLYSSGDPDISFLSSDSSFDIAPGTIGMFSISSLVGPALASDLIRGFDDHSGTFAENSGTILTPSAAVPEPASLVLGILAASCVAAGGLARCRLRVEIASRPSRVESVRSHT